MKMLTVTSPMLLSLTTTMKKKDSTLSTLPSAALKTSLCASMERSEDVHVVGAVVAVAGDGGGDGGDAGDAVKAVVVGSKVSTICG